MAMNEAQKQLMRAMMRIADEQILPFSDTATRLDAMWTILDMGLLADADFQGDAEFAHISAADATAAKNAMATLKTTLGNYASGEPSRSISRISLRLR